MGSLWERESERGWMFFINMSCIFARCTKCIFALTYETVIVSIIILNKSKKRFLEDVNIPCIITF